MNSWYIDRSKNFVSDGLKEALSIINEAEISGQEMSTAALSKIFKQHKALGNAIGNPNAAFTRFRDHGLIRMNNTVGDSAKMYLDNKFSFGELIIDLFIKRFASKDNYPSLRPIVMICKLFSCMMDMGIDEDDIFVTFYECHEYLLPIDSYNDINHDLADKIISEREYVSVNGECNLKHRINLSDNKETNYSIWFNALKQTPLFVYVEDNDNRYTLRPNQKQKEFFKYISENADEFKNSDVKDNPTLYDYYCNRQYGLSEIITPVIKTDAKIDEKDAKTLFDYLFGYDIKVNFDYSKYVKHECFGTYFAFISIPNIAIAKIEDDNTQIAEALYRHIDDMGQYYIDNIEIAYDNVKKGGILAVETSIDIDSNEIPFAIWIQSRAKPSGDSYKEATVERYIQALKIISKRFDFPMLFFINDINEFDDIDKKLRSHPNFDKFNRNYGHGAPSAALAAYRKFLNSQDVTQQTDPVPSKLNATDSAILSAWFVGAKYDGIDHTEEFVSEGVWKYGGNKIDLVDEVKPGDRIAIKATCVQKNGLPFENYGKNISCVIIKAIGTVVENINSKQTLIVDWVSFSPAKRWFAFTGKVWDTVRKITWEDGHNYRNLLAFTFEDKPQPYEDIDIQPDDHDENLPGSTDEPISTDHATETAVFEYKEISRNPQQIIYYGAPGTGKSFKVDRKISEKYPNNTDRDYHLSRVIFHPDYTYSDFVGSIRPVKPKNGNLSYEFVAGPFSELLKKSFLHYEEDFYLVLEEINRGNAAAIFGDLFQLLDRDNSVGKSKYSIDNADIAGFLAKDSRLAAMFENGKVWLPSNFNIVCTMNTADQNVFVLDSAFKRRFAEEYIEIDFSKLPAELKEENGVFAGSTDLKQLFSNTSFKSFVEDLNNSGNLKRNWETFAQLVNHIIDEINEESGSEQIPEDKKLGPFFVTKKDLVDRRSFINKVLHYLKQDVFKYVDFYFTESYQTIYSKYQKDTADIFYLLKRQGE